MERLVTAVQRDSSSRYYRITYHRENGTQGQYFTTEVNGEFAILDFILRTGNSRESVISVEVRVGKRWRRV